MAEDKQAKRKPRVRKPAETVRERAAKQTAKAEAKATKVPKRRIRRAAKAATRPLRKPARVVSWPFRLRPVRFIGRVLSRILWPRYFRNAWAELRQVTWPSRRDTWKLTFAVLVFAIVFGLVSAGTDQILDRIIRRIVFRS